MQQSLILADKQGNVTYVERTLYGPGGQAVEPQKRDQIFEFKIEGFNT
jgi:hypothetical protein